MNEKRAKIIRKKVYGDYSSKFRQYTKAVVRSKPSDKYYPFQTETLIADPRRRAYQEAKKDWMRGDR